MKSKQVGPQIRTRRLPPEKMFLLAAGILIILAALQTATQYFAYSFRYAPVLGGSDGYYVPWAIIDWSMKWGTRHPDVVHRAQSLGLGVLAVGFLAMAITKAMMSNSGKASQHLHGSARWAVLKDIQDAGLLPRSGLIARFFGATAASSGVYVGAWMDKRGRTHYLRHNGPEHVLTYAPTRSGKGVSLVVPTLLSWPQSVFVTDLKRELWELTSGWRQGYANNKVLRFEPAAPDSVKWNPLEELRIGTEHEVGDVQNLATLIIDPNGKGLVDHWQKTAFSLFVGVILHVCYRSRNGDGATATLALVDATLANPDRPIEELWSEMKTYGHVHGENHPAVAMAAQDMVNRPDEEAGSVLSSALSYLSLYRDPVIARNVGTSEFKIKDLVNRENPVSLYIVTTPDDKARLRPLVRIMIAMTVRLLTGSMEYRNGRAVAKHKHRLLMMLDEFPSLGKIEILQESLAFLAGYGIKCYLICQDINQLRSREIGYGHDESITSNCHIQNAFAPNRIETAEHLSKLTGTATVVKEQITTSGKRAAAMLGQVSRTFQEVQRPLLTPDECMRLPGAKKSDSGDIEEAGDMVIYAAGCPAIYGKQPLYFQDPIFAARAAIPAPICTDRLMEEIPKAGVTVRRVPQIHLQ
ncbi:MAG: type IV secretory system conjugative DNA transfer family protein [Azoarcus sp.]|nr:type IV secretory system conjugative DNA transfer family protein [Azoarcus sp.]